MHPPVVHFMSGLPRSGSTLLAAILQQNPAVRHAGIITPVANMMIKLTSVMVEGEFATEFEAETRQRLLRGILTGYYDDGSRSGSTTGDIVIDNNRLWCTRLALLDHLFPASRVICCVRDPVWIIDSFERIMQKDPLLGSRIVPIEQRGTLHDRVNALTSQGGPFGFCWHAFNEAFYSALAHKLIVVEYDRLVTAPRDTLQRLSDLLSLPRWDYDFNDIRFEQPVRFDQALGTPGLHAVRPRVSMAPRRPVLPPDIVSRLAGGSFWRNPDMNPGNATILA
ncbi:sulfotransferase family protein [Gluconacetobacter sacchari]|uniref:Sulfotransferase n=2 Tax=Gluconacetobacter sacchari TaxID=92759 RepID=A0A7W4IGT6_9PROT|nr:sulfotransferase [Gluconacetobacter sacchari]MBB2162609.1 sulfotransferase [Gluconacetobacter sacchari]GBQ22716.1 sulfotransferase [Gluconacetobacter sacchari DSM 12717]